MHTDDKVMLSITALVIGLGLWGAWYLHALERDHPCIAYGPKRTHWILVGKVMTPMHYADCIQRKP